MTQEELIVLVYRLRCCSGTLGDQIATKMSNGTNCSINKLVVLNDYIEILLKYNLETDTNCIDDIDEGFATMVANAKNMCRICDCVE